MIVSHEALTNKKIILLSAVALAALGGQALAQEIELRAIIKLTKPTPACSWLEDAEEALRQQSLYGDSAARNFTDSVGSSQTQASYIRLQNGSVTKKHECSTSPCVDCTFLDYKACYDQADKLGLINKKIGFGPRQEGWRPPLYLNRKEEPCLSGYYPHPQHVGCCQAPE